MALERLERDVKEQSAKIDLMRTDLEAFKKAVELKLAEYDRERTMVSKVMWPIVIALGIGFVMWLAKFLLSGYAR